MMMLLMFFFVILFASVETNKEEAPKEQCFEPYCYYSCLPCGPDCYSSCTDCTLLSCRRVCVYCERTVRDDICLNDRYYYSQHYLSTKIDKNESADTTST